MDQVIDDVTPPPQELLVVQHGANVLRRIDDETPPAQELLVVQHGTDVLLRHRYMSNKHITRTVSYLPEGGGVAHAGETLATPVQNKVWRTQPGGYDWAASSPTPPGELAKWLRRLEAWRAAKPKTPENQRNRMYFTSPQDFKTGGHPLNEVGSEAPPIQLSCQLSSEFDDSVEPSAANSLAPSGSGSPHDARTRVQLLWGQRGPALGECAAGVRPRTASPMSQPAAPAAVAAALASAAPQGRGGAAAHALRPPRSLQPQQARWGASHPHGMLGLACLEGISEEGSLPPSQDMSKEPSPVPPAGTQQVQACLHALDNKRTSLGARRRRQSLAARRRVLAVSELSPGARRGSVIPGPLAVGRRASAVASRMSLTGLMGIHSKDGRVGGSRRATFSRPSSLAISGAPSGLGMLRSPPAARPGHPAPMAASPAEQAPIDFGRAALIGGRFQAYAAGRPCFLSPRTVDRRVDRVELLAGGGGGARVRLSVLRPLTGTSAAVTIPLAECRAVQAAPAGMVLRRGGGGGGGGAEEECYFLRPEVEGYGALLDALPAAAGGGPGAAGEWGAVRPPPPPRFDALVLRPAVNFSRISEASHGEEEEMDTSVENVSDLMERSHISLESSPVMAPARPPAAAAADASLEADAPLGGGEDSFLLGASSLDDEEEAGGGGGGGGVSAAAAARSDRAVRGGLLPALAGGAAEYLGGGLAAVKGCCRALAVGGACAEACLAAGRAQAFLEDPDAPGHEKARTHAQLAKDYPWGKFLAEGAYKQVFKVWSKRLDRMVAISVMDLDHIYDNGAAATVCQELQVSMLLGQLARWGQGGNFLDTIEAFRCDYPPVALWGNAQNPCPQGEEYLGRRPAKKAPRAPTSDRGHYQYIVMELCAGGDVEAAVGRAPQRQLPLGAAEALLFQMLAALATAQRVFGLRHYDVKLLNFLLLETRAPAAEYAVDGRRYHVPLGGCGGGGGGGAGGYPEGEGGEAAPPYYLVKLADFGTADVAPETLERRATSAQITTLENTPPEFLLLGEGALQGYSADMFSLGLAMVHLYTGGAPYEEVLAGVQCPPALHSAVAAHWEAPILAGQTPHQYHILKQVLDDCAEEEEKMVLYHTLYRYMVLFGLPESSEYSYYNSSPVYHTVVDLANSSVEFQKSLHRDQSSFSLSTGTNPLILRARNRLKQPRAPGPPPPPLAGPAAAPGGAAALGLLRSLVAWDPSRRARAPAALRDPLFDRFRAAGAAAAGAVGGAAAPLRFSVTFQGIHNN